MSSQVPDEPAEHQHEVERRDVPLVGRHQGTVSSYDADTRTGHVLLDDGRELAFPAQALDGSRLRLLRPGQRVRLDLDGGTVRSLQILTLA